MTSQINVFIEDYSEKSFVVRGETELIKEKLKSLGGKWSNGFTDKKTNEKFGAWLFWSAKKPEIQDFLNKGVFKEVDKRIPKLSKEKDMEKRIERLENMLDNILSIIGSLDPKLGKKLKENIDYDIDDYEEEPEIIVKPKRLLKK